MSENPYQPPQPGPPASMRVTRDTAVRCTRWTVAVLLGPAIYNVVCFWWKSGGWERDQFAVLGFWLAVVLSVAMTVSASAVRDLEFGTWLLHRWLGRPETADLWQQALYRFLVRLRRAAIPAAGLWTAWCYAFYQQQAPFFLISVPIGIVAHLVAAYAWLPLPLQWFRIERRGVPTEHHV